MMSSAGLAAVMAEVTEDRGESDAAGPAYNETDSN